MLGDKDTEAHCPQHDEATSSIQAHNDSAGVHAEANCPQDDESATSSIQAHNDSAGVHAEVFDGYIIEHDRIRGANYYCISGDCCLKIANGKKGKNCGHYSKYNLHRQEVHKLPPINPLRNVQCRTVIKTEEPGPSVIATEQPGPSVIAIEQPRPSRETTVAYDRRVTKNPEYKVKQRNRTQKNRIFLRYAKMEGKANKEDLSEEGKGKAEQAYQEYLDKQKTKGTSEAIADGSQSNNEDEGASEAIPGGSQNSDEEEVGELNQDMFNVASVDQNTQSEGNNNLVEKTVNQLLVPALEAHHLEEQKEKKAPGRRSKQPLGPPRRCKRFEDQKKS